MMDPKERQFARALDSDGARQDFRSPSPPLSSSDGGAERPVLGEAVLSSVEAARLMSVHT